jgi:hypothetical protein
MLVKVEGEDPPGVVKALSRQARQLSRQSRTSPSRPT